MDEKNSDTRVSVAEIAMEMRGSGGGFVQALGLALLRADLDNAKRIKEAFPEYWDAYAKAARERKARGEEP